MRGINEAYYLKTKQVSEEVRQKRKIFLIIESVHDKRVMNKII